MFQKILIANRGEIACRIMRTARDLGVRTVAVYSDADAKALHVEMADEAWPIGPAPPRESYLNAERILEAAHRSGAEAIHPGYGFLSENAEFAEACTARGIVFIGPPAAAIRSMGLKSAAKEMMARAGVPVVPGYHGEAQDLHIFASEAARIGYPVLVKASAGGGGKGMRVVEREDALPAAIASAAREAASAFGDGRLLLEKYLTRPRHIEIQVFADTHGEVISLFERDCSIQRRYQKVIEEAPAPGMDPARRKDMGEAACAAARTIGYVNAGTVEFIVEGGAFYFMEMNTRLQVEHPVTERITGLDLVEWQLRVAAGEPLPERPLEIRIHGHAIEARVYAEDPARDFRPSTGLLTHLQAPVRSINVRIDTGVQRGDTISVHYDPLIAKLIVWDNDRPSAIGRLRRALGEYEVAGVATNIAFLKAIAEHPEYARGELDTGFIGRHLAELAPASQALPREVLGAAVLRVLSDQHPDRSCSISSDKWSPWNELTAWRMNGEGYQDLHWRDGEQEFRVRVYPRRDGSFRAELPGGEADVRPIDDEFLILDGVKVRVRAVRNGDEITVLREGCAFVLQRVDPLALRGLSEESAGRLTAPMPGRIVQVLVRPGEAVTRGAPLLILEAMKMEYTITAPADGAIAAVRYGAGDVVNEGAELIAFAESS
jgi:3-methylcrotonyl-CoA carboxylase alpha subunit